MFHQTPSRSLTLLSCENQPAFRISPLILYSVRTARYGPQHPATATYIFSQAYREVCIELHLYSFLLSLC